MQKHSLHEFINENNKLWAKRGSQNMAPKKFHDYHT